MKIRMTAALVLTCCFATGEESGAKSPVKTRIVADPNREAGARAVIETPASKPDAKAVRKSPDVEDAIPDPVKALGEPVMMNFSSGIQMAVTAATENAQAHVNQGLNHLHGGWEFEASRHFAAAMQEDPECLLAHWGMLMTLLSPSPETDAARVNVTERMLDLVDQGKGTELERGYCYGLIKYIEEGPIGAANAFRKVAEQFPNDLQATIFAALFSRGGYDEFGSATPDQEAAEESLRKLVEKHPENPVPLNALLSIRADGPDLSGSVDLASKLCQMSPDYAPYFHLLGHYEWRSGHHGRAASAFGRASSHYEKWMRDNKAPVADCPEWVKAECYRIVALVSKGDFDTAYAASRQIASTPIEKGRGASPGGRLLLWEARTLPARILLHRNLPGNATEALASLPKPEEMREYEGKSLAFWWIDGLRLALEGKRQIEAKNLNAARDVASALSQHGAVFSKTQGTATAIGERSLWTRAFRALEVLASDMRGRMSLVGPKDRVAAAYNWFASAVDRQHSATMMFPPTILTPMSNRLGEYYLTVGKPEEAVESYQRALHFMPNDMNALLGLNKAYQKAKRPEDAAATEAKIQQLKAE